MLPDCNHIRKSCLRKNIRRRFVHLLPLVVYMYSVAILASVASKKQPMFCRVLRWSILILLSGQLFSPARSCGQLGPAPAAAADASMAEGQRVFGSSCAACHGLDARGGERGPDIASRRELQQMSDEALLRIVQDGKAGTGMPAFRSLGSAQIEAVVRYLRSLQGRAAAEPVPGDQERGRGLFFGKARCSQCHMANGEGGFIGSDLSSYAGARSADDIRSAITEPNKNLDPRKRPVTVTTLTGKTQTGMARNEDNFSLQIQTLDGSFHFFNKSELRSFEYQSLSLMPSDYGSRLSRQELDDLVSYLMTMGRANTVRSGNKPRPARDDQAKE
jgi:cytochrome c oxidase cbb3-type subunit III